MFITLLADQVRSGVVQSPVVGGSTIPAGATKVTLRAVMQPAVRNNPANAIDFAVYKSRDGGATWTMDVGGHWVGGPDPLDKQGAATPNVITIIYTGESLDNIRNAQVRAQMDVLTSMSVGVEGELV